MATSLLLDHSGQPFTLPDAAAPGAPIISYSQEQRDKIVASLTAPFRLEEISWRVISTTKDKKKGLVAPFVRTGYILERLNTVVGFGRWNKVPSEIRVDVTTKEGTKRTKIAMTCKVEILGIGTNSSTGECWADEDNSVTSCEAQAFKRAAQNLGIGSYLFRVPKFWAELDQNKSIIESPAFQAAAARSLESFLPADQRKNKPGNTQEQKQTPSQDGQQTAATEKTTDQNQQKPAQQ
ncbi:MAG TPA: Rad52/Rad22 family DNA repair protein, partial [Candidatus Binatia bacterium]|nr:Rad52/Rad22 family DNA repair protein [Candidatus Binatia bacterium]